MAVSMGAVAAAAMVPWPTIVAAEVEDTTPSNISTSGSLTEDMDPMETFGHFFRIKVNVESEDLLT